MLPPGSTTPTGRLALCLALVLSVLALAACTGDGDANDDAGEDVDQASLDGANPDDRVSDRQEAKREVRLALTDWTGSRLDLAIAEVLIERQLGYPVTATPVGDYQAMLSALESGELDAVLEIWPSSLSETEQAFFDTGRVADLGPLGVDGEIGWYVPRYVIDDDPALATWEGFTEPGVARRFASTETGARGRFLGTDPSYEQFDEELISSLGLDFDVVYSGSEDATRSELATAATALRPIVLYWWSPTAEIVEFDLIKVELPPRTPECLESSAEGGEMSCGYPVEPLFKAAHPGLADSDPELYEFLRRFRLTTADQLAMIWAVERDQRSIGDVAAEWVEENRAQWTPWFGEAS